MFDVTGLPGAKPTKVATISLTTNPYWITFSLDGRYAYPATGDVIDTTTRKKVFTIVNRASKQVQVDLQAGDPVRVGSAPWPRVCGRAAVGGTARAAGGVGGRVTD